MDMSGGAGYVETRILHHKTRRFGSNQPVQVAAPVPGISGKDWATTWLRNRRSLGLNAGVDGTLLPTFTSPSTWSSARMSSTECGLALREVLRDAGVPEATLGPLGSHSLKATPLSWMAKFGVDRESRKALGYHKPKGDRAMLAYSRDDMAGPLRKYEGVLRAIAAGDFVPDATRSGRFIKPTTRPRSTSPTSTATSSSTPSHSESGKISSGEDEPVQLDDFAGIFIINGTSGIIHRVVDDQVLLRGRRHPAGARPLSTWPASGARTCSRCFA
jgi:hypothetical protein